MTKGTLFRRSALPSILSIWFTFGCPANAEEIQIPVPSDPGAKYFMLNLLAMDGTTLEVESRREGKSGESHAIRLVDCLAGTFDYVYDNDSRSEVFPIENASPNMGSLTDQSISWWVSRFACDKLGMAKGW